jgi:hypothetical protein
MMLRKIGMGCGVALAVVMGSQAALAWGPVNRIGTSPTVNTPMEASFFGRPYPYGYTGWGPCMRYIEVDTPTGPRLRRVWVCH